MNAICLDRGTSSRLINTALILIGLLVLGCALYAHFLTGYYGDKQWEMVYARMWLGGKHLYTDVFPVSPPLIFWAYALPAATAQYISIFNAYEWLSLMGFALIAFCIFICLRLVTFYPAFKEDTKKQVNFVALLVFVLIVRTSTIYFLDREHLFFVLTLPYVLRWMPTLSRARFPRWLRFTTGLLAGIGFCMKPHCFVVFAGIQLLCLLNTRSFRFLASIENLIIYAVGLGYVFLVWQLYPEYFSTVVPMALSTYSETRDENPILFYASNALSILLPPFLLFGWHYGSPYRKDIYYLAALLPFYFFYALVNNNWAYTYYPLSSIALIVSGFLLWEFLYLSTEHASRSLPSWRLWVGGCLCLAAFAFSNETFYRHSYGFYALAAGCIAWEVFYQWRRDKARSIPHWTFWAGSFACIMTFILKLMLSVNITLMIFADKCSDDPACSLGMPFVQEVAMPDRTLSFGAISVEFSRWTQLNWFTGAAWETRFPQLWMLPKFLVSDEAFKQKHQWILDYVANAFTDDMNKNKPEVMFVDDTNIIYGRYLPVDLIAYFSFSPHFKEAWSHYRFERNINFCGHPSQGQPLYKSRCSYDVYRRLP